MGFHVAYLDHRHRYDFKNFSVHAGDKIILTIDATSTSEGTALVDNLTTGQAEAVHFDSWKAVLRQFNIEWMVQATTLPLDFGTIVFQNASATCNRGKVSLWDANTLDTSWSHVWTDRDSVTMNYYG